MITLGLIEAAEKLRMHKSTLAAEARAGKIPGIKNGRAWCFLEDDLVAHMRAKYVAPKQAPVTPCPSTSAPIPKFGTSTSRIPVSLDYVSRLELRIAQKRKKSTTS